MAFDAAFRTEKTENSAASHANSSDLFNRIHDRAPLTLASAQGGSLEPGPGMPSNPIEPPPSSPNTTINNNSRGGDARASSTSRANAAANSRAHSDSTSSANVGNVSSESIGPSISTKTIVTAPPGLGGGECTWGISGGALGFALAGQAPDMDCIREKTDAQKQGQVLDFSVRSGMGAVEAYDHALANVDKANQYNKAGDVGVARAHLDGANAQRQISGSMASESVAAAQTVLGRDSAANSAGAWSASILNDRSVPIAAPVESRPQADTPRHVVHGTVEHKKPVAKKADCP